RIGLESTVVRLIDERVEILRPGGITLEQLLADGFSAHYFDPGSDPVPVANASPDTLPSPGMLDRHYAPSVPLLFFEREYAGPNNSADLRELIQQYKLPTGKIGSLYFESLDKAQSIAGINDLSKTIQSLSEYSLELSSKGDLIEAAARLFRLFDTAAEAGLACLLVCAVPDEGLGRAINDRLRRAATFVLR
ncbi:MAG: hypothetical protein KDK34_13515, partial [Leptospiraceae bacterium]|nr:hypothetical protein [Leptospiraceae bacterium]